MRKFGNGLFSRLERPIIALAVAAPPAAFIESHVVSLGSIKGRSMQPTLNPDTNKQWKDVVLLDKRIRRHNFSRGEVVLFRSPKDPNVVAVKRITAIAVFPRNPDSHVPLLVPDSHVFVEGDERFHSIDSNEYGPISTGLILAVVTRVLFPFDRAGAIPVRPIRDGSVVRAKPRTEIKLSEGG